jgi:hypothetical protein
LPTVISSTVAAILLSASATIPLAASTTPSPSGSAIRVRIPSSAAWASSSISPPRKLPGSISPVTSAASVNVGSSPPRP